MCDEKFITIIVPAYKAAKTIGPCILGLSKVLREKIGVKFEIIVVVDGDIDGTSLIIQELNSSNVRMIVNLENHGKGHALRCGIEAASDSTFIGFLDADLDLDPNGLFSAYNVLTHNQDVSLAVGSKLHSASVINYPFLRRMQSRIFAKFVQLAFRFKLLDTQTGLKLGRGELMRDAALATKTNGFAFDLEFLLFAKRYGATFESIPIKMDYQFESTLAIRTYIEIVRDFCKIFLLSLQLQNTKRNRK